MRTPLTLLEHYTLTDEQAAAFVRELTAEGLAAQALVLSTCNRTELYAFGGRAGCEAALRERFVAIGCNGQADLAAPPVYEYEGTEAARHLFAVEAGLDSMILGENQIKGQIRAAFDLSQSVGAAGAELTRLVESSHRCGKRIRTETDLNVGTLCVGKAAVLKGEAVLRGLAGRVCVVIGAGKIGRLAARALAERGPSELWIVNRSLENARAIAAEVGGRPHPLEELDALLPRAEFILGAAFAPELILTRDRYEAACAGADAGRCVCMVDAAVPRILDPALADRPELVLYDLEHMQEIIEMNRARRTDAAERAWQIVTDEIEKYRAAQEASRLAPLIEDLKLRAEQIVEEQMGSADGSDGPQAEEQLLRRHRLKSKLLHEMIQELKARAEVKD